MKLLNTLLVAIVLPGCLLSQVSIDTITPAFPGDTIERYVELAPEGVVITDPGGDQEWDWTLDDNLVSIAAFDTNDRSAEFPFANIKMTEGGRDQYFIINSINWGLQGFVAEDPLGMGLEVTSFYEPEFSVDYAPAGFQDTIVQVFAVYTGIPLSVIPDSLLDMLPLVPDSLRLKVSTLVFDDFDAWGRLNITGTSGSVEMSELVLRQRRETFVAIAVEAKISILPWVDVTEFILDAVDSLPGDIDLTDTIVSYRFLAPGYALPIAEITVDDNTVQSVVYQAKILTAVKDVVFEPSEIKIFPNPTSGDINISVPDNERQIDQVIVTDLTGRMIHSARVSDQELVQIQLNGVADGMYFLILLDEKGALLGTGKVSLIGN